MKPESIKPEFEKLKDTGMCAHGNFINSCESCADESENDPEEEKEKRRAKRRSGYDANILPPTEGQIAFAESLGFDREGVAKDSRAEVSRVLSIKSEQKKEEVRHQVIKERGFAPGMRVRKIKDGAEYTISSIKIDGWLCFKGARGGGSNPEEYEVIEEGK